MAEIDLSENSRGRRGVQRAKKHILRVDMTPMVDLGFILITFFVMTVELSKPASFNLAMPKEGGPPTTLGESNALTVLLDDNNRMFYYHGDWKHAVAENRIYPTNMSVYYGLGKVVREKQKWLDIHNNKEGRSGLVLLIKPCKGASYKNVIKALDEALINCVKKYTVLSADKDEMAWMNEHR